MRQFTAEYLETTREGMWADSREALEPLSLANRERVLDVGAGTGALTAVLRQECSGEVIAVDADPGLLRDVPPPGVCGDATRLPVCSGAVDLVVCQALLVNLPDPDGALQEFARVSRDVVAAIEPDNSRVTIRSTVDAEPPLARRARELYLDGVETDAALGAMRARFERAGVRDVTVTRYDHVRTISPPYSECAVESARRKATGEGLASDRAEILAGDVTREDYEVLHRDWQEMGTEVIAQMSDGDYRRVEVVPFFVTVGRVGQ